MELISITTDWTLSNWLTKLKAKFVKKSDRKGSIFMLSEMKKNDNEDMDAFNNRFQKYVTTIPADMRTDGLVKKVYTDILLTMDRDLWWNCSKLDEASKLEDLMNETSKMMEIKEQAAIKKSTYKASEDARKLDPESTKMEKSERNGIQASIDQLTREMRQMALLSQKEPPKRDFSDITCYNCNQKGHTSRVCKVKSSDEGKRNVYPEEKKIMLALDKPKANMVNFGGGNSKRPRLENLLNSHDGDRGRNFMNPRRVVDLPRLGSTKSLRKKKQAPNRAEHNPEWAKRVLESQAPISVKEVLNLKPKMIKVFIKSLQKLERAKEKNLLYAEYSDSETSSGSETSSDEEDIESLSYLTTYVKHIPILLFLDPGAAYSIISEKLVLKLDLKPTKLKSSIKIKPVSGNVIEIRKGIELPIEFDDGSVVRIPFIVLSDCAVPILLGLDACMRLKAKINYSDETFTLTISKKNFTYQLYSKDMLDEEFSENHNLENEESIPLLYASMESEISNTVECESEPANLVEDTQFMEEMDSRINQKLDAADKHILQTTLVQFEDIFAKGFKDITGINNSAVSQLYNNTDPTGRVARWISFLSEYHFTLQHRSGKLNQVADFLSRPALITRVELERGQSKKVEEVTFSQIKSFLAGSDDLCEAKVRQKAKKFVLIQQDLFRKSKDYLLKVIESKDELEGILSLLHEKRGHFAFETIYGYLKSKYWRPQLFNETKHYAKSCYECQSFLLRRPKYKFDGRSGISGIFQSIQIDHLGPLPESKSGKRYILVCIERLTGYPWLWAVPDQTAATTCRCLKELVASIGPPKTLQCDNAGGFRSKLLQEYCKDMKIKVIYNVPYQPEWLGAVERLNSTVRYALAKSCMKDYSEWDLKIPEIATGIRMRKTSRTGLSPFHLLFGVEARLPIEWESEDEENLQLRNEEIGTLTGSRKGAEQETKHSPTIPEFELGSRVLVLNGRIRKRNPGNKILPRYDGPYEILETHVHGLYTVKSEVGDIKCFHVSRLVKFLPRNLNPSEGERGE
ncbi:Pro-Pol polyprotein [Smittium culicis]|uniref:Pro-Pol polyprotein n=1 Tax=Smittium culicis TaxID=133412 RepID=A0A1R1YNY0_9FUNG|nr:Pro-Pol polyprotein [Smittium culicis]